MKGQSHLTIFADPILDWKHVPTAMYGECGAEVLNPTAVDSFTVSGGRLPDFDSMSTCGKCIVLVGDKRRYSDDPEGKGEEIPAPFYVYAIADKKEIEAHEMKHSGETISNLERTVAQVSGGLSKTSAPVKDGKQ